MAQLQHASIPDGNRHEPKGISTATSGQLYVADGASSGDWRGLTESDLDFTVPANNKFGWNYRVDSTYTSGSTLALASGVKTLITNNGGGALTDTTRPLGITYDANGFTPTTLNSSYVIRVGIKLTAAAVAGTPYVCKLTLEGGSTPATFAAQDCFIKGGGYINDLAITYLFFTGSNNTNYPIKLYATTDTDMAAYNISLLIQRTYVEV